MGNWFSNIQIRKREDLTTAAVAEAVAALLTQRQYLPAASAEESDGEVAIIAGETVGWITVCSDLLRHTDPETCSSVASQLSAALGTDVMGLACFDSDYTYLNYINAAEALDAWIGIGRGADFGISRRNSFAKLKTKVADYPAFSAAAKEKYALADEFLEKISHCLNLPMISGCADAEYLDDIPAQFHVNILYFKLPERTSNNKTPALEFSYAHSRLPCLAGYLSELAVTNKGVDFVGLTIRISIQGAGMDDLICTEATLRDSVFSEETNTAKSRTTSIVFSEAKLPDGSWAYEYHDPLFKFPALPPKMFPSRAQAKHPHRFALWLFFVPLGNPRKMLDIDITFIPDQYPDAQITWNVWKPFGSKAAFIKEHNRIWKAVRRFDAEENCLPLLREEDFD